MSYIMYYVTDNISPVQYNKLFITGCDTQVLFMYINFMACTWV